MTAFVHFVGFKNERFHNAVKVFGKPDFYHRRWDSRAISDISPEDIVVFADGDENQPRQFTWNDSEFF
jgi:hypothetical protein